MTKYYKFSTMNDYNDFLTIVEKVDEHLRRPMFQGKTKAFVSLTRFDGDPDQIYYYETSDFLTNRASVEAVPVCAEIQCPDFLRYIIFEDCPEAPDYL